MTPPTTARSSNAGWVTTTALLAIALVIVGVLWGSDHSNLTNQVASTNSRLADSQTQIASAQLEALHPTLGTWNVGGPIGPNSYRAGSVPDTFTFHLRFTSSGTVFFV